MNILYLNNEMTIGGVAKCILKLSKELKESNNIFIASKKNGALLSEFEKIGIKNYPIRDVKNKLPTDIIYNIIRITKLVKEKKIDIIHSHHRMTTLIAKIVSKITGVKVIHTQHLCIEDKFILTNISLKNIQTITVSESAKRILVEKAKLDANKIITIYNTVETENDNKEIDNKLINLKNEGYFVVAQVSRAVEYKGVYDFIDIAKLTIKENYKVRFVFIGDGPELKNMQKIIDNNKLNNYIYLFGSKNNIIEYLKYIDLVILCSYIEGLPLVPLEAFSQGIPVIATNIDGTNEEIENGQNGYLVQVGEVEKFKEYIIKLSRDCSLLKKFNEKSKSIYNERFNEKLYISNHKKIYKKEIR